MLRLILIIFFLFCWVSVLFPQSTPTAEQWKSDLDTYAQTLEKKHKDLFHKTSRESFYEQLHALKADLPHLDSHQIIARWYALNASIGDSHTSIYFPQKHILPLGFYWFEDGIYVTGATKTHPEVLFSKVLAIDGHPIDSIISTLTRLIAYENKQIIKNRIPQDYIVFPQLMYGIGLIQSPDSATFTFEKSGKTFTQGFKTTPIPVKDWIAYDSPIYLRNNHKNYWYIYDSTQAVLYFNYRRCQKMKNVSVKEFCEEMFNRVQQEHVTTFLIDLRNNPGGNSNVLAPFYGKLKAFLSERPNCNVYIAIGRRTFSSAILNAAKLKHKFPDIPLIGEPSGGSMQHFGEVKNLTLPQTGMRVWYSTDYYDLSKTIKGNLKPDIPISYSMQEYIAGKDPVIQYLLR